MRSGVKCSTPLKLRLRRRAHTLSGEARAALRIVYTPLHGTGNVPVREVLAHEGFTNVSVVAAQEAPDGDFSTVRSPNPEERDALRLAIAQAEEEGAIWCSVPTRTVTA